MKENVCVYFLHDKGSSDNIFSFFTLMCLYVCARVCVFWICLYGVFRSIAT